MSPAGRRTAVATVALRCEARSRGSVAVPRRLCLGEPDSDFRGREHRWRQFAHGFGLHSRERSASFGLGRECGWIGRAEGRYWGVRRKALVGRTLVSVFTSAGLTQLRSRAGLRGQPVRGEPSTSRRGQSRTVVPGRCAARDCSDCPPAHCRSRFGEATRACTRQRHFAHQLFARRAPPCVCPEQRARRRRVSEASNASHMPRASDPRKMGDWTGPMPAMPKIRANPPDSTSGILRFES